MPFGQSALIGIIAGEVLGMVANVCNTDMKHTPAGKAAKFIARTISKTDEDAEKALQFIAENKNLLQAGAALTVGGIVATATMDSLGGSLVAIEVVMYASGANPFIVVNILITLLGSLSSSELETE